MRARRWEARADYLTRVKPVTLSGLSHVTCKVMMMMVVVVARVLRQGTLVIRTEQRESSPEPHSPRCSIRGPQKQNRAKDLRA